MKIHLKPALGSLAAGLLLLQPAAASLAKGDGLLNIFQMLGDLTRPDGLRHLGHDAAVPSAASSNQHASGIQWSVEPAHKTVLENGNVNSPAFRLVTKGQTPANKKRPADGSPTRPNTNPGITNADEALNSSKFKPIKPPSYPLAVRSPYLNAWLPAGSSLSSTPPNSVGDGGYLAGEYPAFWTSSYGADGEFRLGWTGYIRVDGTTYQWMGNGFGTLVRAGKAATQLSVEYTATRTIFRFDADGVKFTVTFLTPITPDDYLRQSLPLSYLYFELDQPPPANRSVQMYTDIDERWVTGHDYDYQGTPYDVRFSDKGNSSMYFVTRKSPQVYTEFRQRAEWGNATYAARAHKGLSSRNNNNIVTQSEFIKRGNVTFDHGPTLGPDNSYAFAVDFDVKGAAPNALFVVGHMRSPYVNYIRAKKPGSGSTAFFQEDRYGYWQTKFDTLEKAVSFFVDDFDSALAGAKQFDQQIVDDSKAVAGGGEVGDRYAAITTLSVRQAFATFEITVAWDNKTQSYNTSDTLLFLKEISSNGDMSTVDVIFPLFPLLSYTNPRLLRDLLQPIFEYTESGLYPNKWCVHDLGVYPNAFGHNDGNDEPMQVEESGNMIWMALHYAQLVGKKAAEPWLRSHYAIMKQWAEFLIEDSLIPATQLSTDDFAGTLANQTNLAIKGIEGIAAMGAIADMLGESADAKSYRNVSTTYVKLWQGFALSKDKSHTKLAYQDDASWGTLYNLFGDRLLNLQLVPRKIYDIQDAWYAQKALKYAVPLDSRHKWAKTDWEMFAAATTDDPKARDLFIDLLYAFVSNGLTDAPFTDLMQADTGDFPKDSTGEPTIHFLARPVVGGHFALLAKAKADKANGVSQYAYAPADSQGDEDGVDEAMLQRAFGMMKDPKAYHHQSAAQPPSSKSSPSSKSEASTDGTAPTAGASKTPADRAKKADQVIEGEDKKGDAAAAAPLLKRPSHVGTGGSQKAFQVDAPAAGAGVGDKKRRRRRTLLVDH
ncbi:uncharacterized protein PFL1_06780 [Pseudozyma flocculosa PF-1]|uniref:Glutaminase A n=2 Tax=Pseudozyma flocculosa TaxID=84751 RepID=A0A061H0M8_9BASI|nr:uncharacterized protein PFL1_06780 [Pseudozyma flocculosa PF-1]EPQ25643.1 hypothetical protein PFL1_06780 [Pseudozyma flocculosa PF-1]SPO42050.1 probable glutaminase A [Pseudozyma flocculosa]